MKLVLDTNVLVSALWSPGGAPASVVGLVLTGQATACYDHRIMAEYRQVLTRPRLAFDPPRIAAFLADLTRDGLAVIAPFLNLDFTDPDGKPFFEVALACQATLVTGNAKHFPGHRLIKTPRQILDDLGGRP